MFLKHTPAIAVFLAIHAGFAQTHNNNPVASGIPRQMPSRAAFAAKLAHQLLHPKDDSSPGGTILDLLTATSLGVYDVSGGTILRGAERSVTDFYLYDFELDAMQAAIDRGDAISLNDF